MVGRTEHMRSIIGDFLATYFLLLVFSPMLGFTFVLEIGYLISDQPIWALLWMFVFGPAILGAILFSIYKATGGR